MQHVHMFVEKLVRVESSMHPVDTNLNQREVQHSEQTAGDPAANFLDCVVNQSPAIFHKVFIDNWEESVEN